MTDLSKTAGLVGFVAGVQLALAAPASAAATLPGSDAFSGAAVGLVQGLAAEAVKTAVTRPLGLALKAAPMAAPEPASWAMMLIGFGAIGTVVRRRGRLSIAAKA